jgi:hypothetical protein
LREREEGQLLPGTPCWGEEKEKREKY